MTLKRYLLLVLFVFIVMNIGFLGGIATESSVHTWYPTLKKPSFNPPNWVFQPVWTVLYLMIAAAGWFLAIQEKSKDRTKALMCYFAQLFFVGIWPFLFFYLQNPLLGLLNMVVLIGLVVLTIESSWSVSRAACLLLLPYLLWIIFAATLNTAIVVLNS